jgi:hypothetical protein
MLIVGMETEFARKHAGRSHAARYMIGRSLVGPGDEDERKVFNLSAFAFLGRAREKKARWGKGNPLPLSANQIARKERCKVMTTTYQIQVTLKKINIPLPGLNLAPFYSLRKLFCWGQGYKDGKPTGCWHALDFCQVCTHCLILRV